MKKVFDEIFVDMTRFGTKIPTSEYSDIGKYIIVDQSQNQVAGYTDNEQGLFNDLPAIIFGDHTRVIKYVDKPFFLGADGTKILKSKLKNVNYKYLFYALQNAKIPNTGYNRHFKWLKSLKINYPSALSQSSTVMLLDKISHIIDCKKKKMDLLDSLVKARFVEMFGMPISNTKMWSTEKMDKVAPIVYSKKKDIDNVWLLNLDMVEANTGRIIDYLFVHKNEIGSSTYSFDTSNVLYSKLRPYLNKVVIPDRCGYATSELLPLQPKNGVLNREYLAYMLRSKEFVTMINEKVAGAKMPRVSMNDFRNFKVPIPPLKLQCVFADFVQQVDKSKASNTMVKNIQNCQLDVII